MFKIQPAKSMLSNNKNERTGRRKQGGIMVEVKGDFAKHATSTGADFTGLGRQNYVDVENGIKKIRFLSGNKSVRSTLTLVFYLGL